MAESAPPARKKRSLIGRVLPYLIGIPFLLAIPTVIGVTCHRDYALRESRALFIAQVDAGNKAGAYDELTKERQAAMTLEAFEAYLDHPVLAHLDDGTYYQPEEHHPGVCMAGRIPMPEGEWYIQLFFLDEDRWRLHSLALQRPARVALGDILPECGFHSGSLQGYGGPRPEHALPPTWKL